MPSFASTRLTNPGGDVIITVRRYDFNNNKLSSLIWHKCKRPAGRVARLANDVEIKARDVARRCIAKENFLSFTV